MNNMKVKPHLFSYTRNLDSLVAALAGFILIQFFAKHSGIGVSPDSVTYLSAARHLYSGKGFISFDNLPVVDFPFGYPFFLTIISWITRQEPLQFAPVLNGILFGILLYLSGSIMNGFQKPSGWYKRILLLCILMSPALQEVYSLLWSETVFLILILLFIVSLYNYLNKMTIGWLWISAAVCAWACVTRYAGIFLLPAGLSLLFFNQDLIRKIRIRHCLLFGAVSVTPFLFNILRNNLLTGLAMGQRLKNNAGIVKIMENFGGGICDWLSLERKPGLAVFISFAVGIIFISAILILYRQKKSRASFEYITAVTGLAYGVFMLLTSSLTRYEALTSRLLAPIFIPLVWTMTWWIPEFLSGISLRYKWIFGALILLGTAWYLNVQLAADYEYYDGVKDAGVPGYREDPFVQSEIVRAVNGYKKSFDPALPIYSNAGEAVYFVTGLPARQLPFTAYPAKLQAYYALKNSYLVWFRDLDNPDMPTLDSILRNKNLQLVKELPDGAIYQSR
jgi:hypothetical protein